MAYTYNQGDSHLNPETALLLNNISRIGGRGAPLTNKLFNALYLASDENGEIVSTRAAIAEYLECNLGNAGTATKLLSEAGLIEYKLSRGRSGNLYRINPQAISTGKKFQHLYKKLADVETGESTRLHKVELAEEFKRLCRRYNGNQLNTKMIAAERKLFKLITSQTTQLHTL
jgi:hypothetical protein